MSTWVASKYDAANDPHMPKVGAPSPDGAAGNRAVLVVDHPTRPFVKYFVWVK